MKRELKYFTDSFGLICDSGLSGENACTYTMIVNYCTHQKRPKNSEQLNAVKHAVRAFYDKDEKAIVRHPHPQLWYGEAKNCDKRSQSLYKMFISLSWAKKEFKEQVSELGQARPWYFYPIYFFTDFKHLMAPKSVYDLVECHFAATNRPTLFSVIANFLNRKRSAQVLSKIDLNVPPLEKYVTKLYARNRVS